MARPANSRAAGRLRVGSLAIAVSGGVLVALVAVGSTAGETTSTAPIPDPPTETVPTRSDLHAGDAAKAPRLREGTRLTDRLGRFRQEGESLTFVDEGGRELGSLPNLNLERIVRVLKGAEEPEGIWWSVSGLVTEFSGRNFLLITRATYKSAAPPPAPDVVE